MPKRKEEPEQVPFTEPRGITLEARENQLIALAVDVAEERLRNGTATSQEICHFLRLGSTREQVEKEMAKEKVELMKAKKEMMESAKKVEELYAEAISAFQLYSGNTGGMNAEDIEES